MPKITTPLTYDFENCLRARGFALIAGTDEAGRGPLAGAVYAAAVILPEGCVIEGLNDSKKLSEARRERLYDVICERAIAHAVAFASAAEIDEINILNASQLAMRRAVEILSPTADFVLIDGNVSRGFTIPNETIIGGDGISPSIAAASILAKVSRDRVMKALDERFPQYGFAIHKGYPTAAHMDAVRKYGPCSEHRRTFLRFLDK